MLSGSLVKTITADGIELQGFWINKKSEIAVFHSHGTAGDFYSHKFIEVEGKKLASHGISFLTANNRGHDVITDLKVHKKNKIEWRQIGGAFERFEDSILDLQAWIDFLIEHGVKKIILQGHSLGPNKIVYYQSLKNNPNVVGQIHLSPCDDAGYMYYLLGEEKYKRTNTMIKKMINEGREKEMLPKELFVVCPMAALAYYGYLTEEGIGNTFPYHNPEATQWKMLNKVKEPILVFFGSTDDFIKPSIQIAANLFRKNAKSSKEVVTKIIKGASHSYIGFEDQLVKIIFSWIKKNFL